MRVIKRRRDGVTQRYNIGRIKRHSEIQKLPVSLRRDMVNANNISLANSLKKEGRVRIADIGILTVKTRPARKAKMGINPFTGVKQKFKARPAQKIVRFRPAKSLKGYIN